MHEQKMPVDRRQSVLSNFDCVDDLSGTSPEKPGISYVGLVDGGRQAVEDIDDLFSLFMSPAKENKRSRESLIQA